MFSLNEMKATDDFANKETQSVDYGLWPRYYDEDMSDILQRLDKYVRESRPRLASLKFKRDFRSNY